MLTGSRRRPRPPSAGARNAPTPFGVPDAGRRPGGPPPPARRGRPNAPRHEPLYIVGPGREATRSELDVPLKLGQRILGVLNVESERANAFAAEDVPYLQGLAGQLAQAIENARLAAHSRELAAAEERARVARDLHDETIQALVGLGRQLDLLALDLEEPDRKAALQRLERIQGHLGRTIEGVRRLSRNLRPAALEDLGLVAALRSLAADLSGLGLEVDVSLRGQAARLPRAIEEAVY